jgi:hypothetical protein
LAVFKTPGREWSHLRVTSTQHCRTRARRERQRCKEAMAFGRYVRNAIPAMTLDFMRGVPFHGPHAAPGFLVHPPGGPGPHPLPASGHRPGRRLLRAHGCADPRHDHRGGSIGSSHSDRSFEPSAISSSFSGLAGPAAEVPLFQQAGKVQNRFQPASRRGERRPLFPRSARHLRFRANLGLERWRTAVRGGGACVWGCGIPSFAEANAVRLSKSRTATGETTPRPRPCGRLNPARAGTA